MYNYVLYSNKEDFWLGYGVLIENINKNYYVLDDSYYNSMTDFNVLKEQSKKYKYIKEINFEDVSISIKANRVNEFFLNIFLNIEYENVYIEREHLLSSSGLNFDFYNSFLFQENIEEATIIKFINEIENLKIKNKQELYEGYKKIGKSLNLLIDSIELSLDLHISKLSN